MAKVSCSPSNNTHALTLQSICQMVLAPGGGGIYKMMVENRTMNYPPTQKKELVDLQGIDWKTFDRG